LRQATETRAAAAGASLATYLGFDWFRVVGEDWGAATAYAVAAFHRPRVRQLVFQEPLPPGLPGPWPRGYLDFFAGG